MHRLIVAILSVIDAAIAVAVGVGASLAPLTLLWVFTFGGGADWSALWPAAAVIWQLGNLVPFAVELPAEYIVSAGIAPDAASFALSLAPLAFAAFTVIFAARSGARASRAEAWLTGVLTGTAVFAVGATAVALTSSTAVARAQLWTAIVIPTLLYAVPALVAAFVTEWSEADTGGIARLRVRVLTSPHEWGRVPGLVARGSAVAVTGLIGLGAALTAVALVARGGEVIALYQAANVDALGATMLTLGQLAYLPTLVFWGIAFIAGPGFAIGAGTAVTAAGTQAGVVPGIPVLGILPESTTPWMLLLVLLPIALGAFAGWIARSRLVATARPAEGPAQTAAGPSRSDSAHARTLAGLLATPANPTAAAETGGAAPDAAAPDAAAAVVGDGGFGAGGAGEAEDPVAARLAITAGIAAVAAVAAALLAAAASGSLGPGRLAELGPAPGPVALAVGLEVAVGAGILLLSPRAAGRERRSAPDRAAAADRDAGPGAVADPIPDGGESDAATSADAVPTLDLGTRRVPPIAPLD